jgi:hypothetical protein
MSIVDYASLQTSILSWLARDADTIIPVTDLITLAEAEMNRFLLTQNQLKTDSLTTIAGQQAYTLPADFLGIMEVKVTSTSPIWTLRPMSPDLLDTEYAFTADTDIPQNYSLYGGSIYFGPIPDAAYTIQLLYYGAIPALSNTNTTNWLLTRHPDAYLWTTLRHAEVFLGSDATDDRTSLFDQRSQVALQAIRNQDIRGKTGGSPVMMATYLQPRDFFP